LFLCTQQTDEQLAAETSPADDDDVAKATAGTDDAYDNVIAEHFACWRLDRRGAVGETALHLCMLYSKLPEFRAISVALLDIFPKLSVDYYEGDEYYGIRGCRCYSAIYCSSPTKKCAFFLTEDQKKHNF